MKGEGKKKERNIFHFLTKKKIREKKYKKAKMKENKCSMLAGKKYHEGNQIIRA